MTRRRWKLNARFLLPLVALGAAALIGGYFWHGYQVRLNASAFLERAELLADEETWEEAARNYDRYLKLVPDDVDVWVRLAETFDRAAKSRGDKQRAAELYFKTLALVPDRVDLRRRQAQLLLEIGRSEAALRQADEVLATPGTEDAPDCWNVKAIATHQLYRFGERAFDLNHVVEVLRRATRFNASREEHVELATRLASIYRDERGAIYRETSGGASEGSERDVLTSIERNEIADDLMKQMVDANPDRAAAYLARFRYRESYGLPVPDGEDDLGRAQDLNSEQQDPGLVADVKLTMAGRALADGQVDEASKQYRKLVQQRPFDSRGYLGLARCLVILHATNTGSQKDPLDEAVEVLHDGLEKVGGGDFDLTAMYARLLARRGQLDEADKALATLQRIENDRRLYVTPAERARMSATLDLLRCEMSVAKGEYQVVPELVQRILARELTATNRPEELAQARMVRGRAYALQGAAFTHFQDWDRAAEAYSHAVGAAPELFELRLQAGWACERAGQWDEAANHYQQLAQLAEADPVVWVRLARARLRQQRSRPPEQRSWEGVEQALADAQEKTGDTFDVNFLASQCALAQDRAQQALQRLQQAEAAGPQTATDWRNLILAYQEIDEILAFQVSDELDHADEALKRFTEVWDDPVDPLLTRAELLTRRKQDDAARRVLDFEDPDSVVSSLAPTDQNRVRVFLAELDLRAGRRQEARKHLEAAVEAVPDDLGSLRRLGLLALESEYPKAAQPWEDRLRRLEGPSGTGWRMIRAQRLLLLAESSDDPRLLEEVERLAREVVELRPRWAHSHRLMGMLLVRQGNTEEASRSYQQARQLDRPAAGADPDLARMIDIWSEQQKGTEPSAEILPPVIAQSRPGSAWAIALKVYNGETQAAASAAEEAVRQRPQDPIAQLYLGITLRLRDRLDEAEQAFLKARQLAPENSQLWDELFNFYVDTGKHDQARQLLIELASAAQIPEPSRGLSVARGYRRLGDYPTADQRYGRLVEKFPNNTVVLLQASQYYQARDIDRAEALLRGARKLAPRQRTVRRALADVLASRGTEEALKEARDLLCEGSTEVPTDPDDRRSLARILVGRGGVENRREAAALLEGLVNDATEPSGQDQMQLATIYESTGRLDEAAALWKDLAGRPNVRPEWIAEQYAAFLLRAIDRGKGEFAPEAALALDRLEKVAPTSLQTVRLKIRRWKQLGRDQEMRGEIDRYVESQRPGTPPDPQSQAQLLAQQADLYRLADMDGLAEEALREAVKIHPPARLWLAGLLARRDSEEATLEAVQTCLEAIESNDSLTGAVTLCNVLRVGKPSAEADRIAESVLAEAEADYGQDTAFLFARGSLHQMRGEIGEAEERYRRVLQSDPANRSALNNLANLLAEVGKADEARQLIDRAIGLVGPDRGLLDTRGMVCLAQGETDEAIKWFEELTAKPDPRPIYYFHLALAYRQAGKPDDARKALERARRDGLKPHTLLPGEREKLRELDSLVAQAPAS